MVNKRDISTEDSARWQELRARSAHGMQAHLAAGPGSESPLDRLAWKAGSLPEPQYSFDNDLREKIEEARAARYSWREISAALGEGDDEVSARRVKDKQAWRNKSYDAAQSEAD